MLIIAETIDHMPTAQSSAKCTELLVIISSTETLCGGALFDAFGRIEVMRLWLFNTIENSVESTETVGALRQDVGLVSSLENIRNVYIV